MGLKETNKFKTEHTTNIVNIFSVVDSFPDFVAHFEELFKSSNPNAAHTFTGDDRKIRRDNIQGITDPELQATGDNKNNNNNNGPLIMVLSQPRMVGSSSNIIEYNMAQWHNRHHKVRSYRSNNSWRCPVFRVQSLSIMSGHALRKSGDWYRAILGDVLGFLFHLYRCSINPEHVFISNIASAKTRNLL